MRGTWSRRFRPLPASSPPTVAPVLVVSSISTLSSGAWGKPSVECVCIHPKEGVVWHIELVSDGHATVLNTNMQVCNFKMTHRMEVPEWNYLFFRSRVLQL